MHEIWIQQMEISTTLQFTWCSMEWVSASNDGRKKMIQMMEKVVKWFEPGVECGGGWWQQEKKRKGRTTWILKTPLAAPAK